MCDPCDKAVECSWERMEKDLRKKWRNYKKIGCGKQRSKSGARCSPSMACLSNSSGEIEGRVKRKGGDVVLDLTMQKPKTKSSGSPLCRLCHFAKNRKKDQEKQRIFRKMDHLELELDEVARRIKKELKKKIAAVKEIEGCNSNPKPCKHGEKKKSVHRSQSRGENVTITETEDVKTGGRKESKTVKRTEDHELCDGSGYKVKSYEKYSTDKKDGKYTVVKKQVVKGDSGGKGDSSGSCSSGGKKHKRKGSSGSCSSGSKKHKSREGSSGSCCSDGGKKHKKRGSSGSCCSDGGKKHKKRGSSGSCDSGGDRKHRSRGGSNGSCCSEGSKKHKKRGSSGSCSSGGGKKHKKRGSSGSCCSEGGKKHKKRGSSGSCSSGGGKKHKSRGGSSGSCCSDGGKKHKKRGSSGSCSSGSGKKKKKKGSSGSSGSCSSGSSKKRKKKSGGSSGSCGSRKKKKGSGSSGSCCSDRSRSRDKCKSRSHSKKKKRSKSGSRSSSSSGSCKKDSHTNVKSERIVTKEGIIHDITVKTTEKTKGKNKTTKTVTEHTAEGPCEKVEECSTTTVKDTC